MSSPAGRFAASARTVGASNSDRTPRSVPKASLMREITRVATSELPPSSKKLSSAPTSATPSWSAKIAASAVSVGDIAAAPRAPAKTGSGSALRSSLPTAVSGISSSTMIAAGTMWAGSRAASAADSCSGSRVQPASGST
ncbi:hypothetical protein L612_003500000250 [Rhodococcus rhodochrous J38]|nr:hypothetical protein L612_003500000250 [Rhodococcus rhodochrous J38]